MIFGKPLHPGQAKARNAAIDVFKAQNVWLFQDNGQSTPRCKTAQCCAWRAQSPHCPSLCKDSDLGGQDIKEFKVQSHLERVFFSPPFLVNLKLKLTPCHTVSKKLNQIWGPLSFSVSEIWICSKTESQYNSHTCTMHVLLACCHNTSIYNFLFSKLCFTNNLT